MNDRDFAIVVAVNKYEDHKGFTELLGPANDAEDMVDWLKSPSGGALPPANVDPYVRLSDDGGTSPTVTDITRVLRNLFTRPRTTDQPIGRRLYVFMAGHGFTTGVTLALLHAAETRRQAPAYISGTQWLDCFHEKALFDELVLFMDCCRDYEGTFESPSKPCLSGLDTAANKVKRLYLMATGIGRGAYERKTNGKVRGLFSRALIEALRGDAVDGDGRMTAANVAESVRRALEPEASAGLNQFPDPICTPGFVLFDNLTPRRTLVTVRLSRPGLSVQLFAGSDDRFEHAIPPSETTGESVIFDLPRGKTYHILASDANGRTVEKRSIPLRNDPVEVAL